MACRLAAQERYAFAVQGRRRALRGAAWSLPVSNRGGNGRSHARPCFDRCPVAVHAGFAWILDHLVLGSVFCARRSRKPRNTGADMGQLVLKRASASRLSGEWSDDDYDVLARWHRGRLP